MFQIVRLASGDSRAATSASRSASDFSRCVRHGVMLLQPTVPNQKPSISIRPSGGQSVGTLAEDLGQVVEVVVAQADHAARVLVQALARPAGPRPGRA